MKTVKLLKDFEILMDVIILKEMNRIIAVGVSTQHNEISEEMNKLSRSKIAMIIDVLEIAVTLPLFERLKAENVRKKQHHINKISKNREERT